MDFSKILDTAGFSSPVRAPIPKAQDDAAAWRKSNGGRLPSDDYAEFIPGSKKFKQFLVKGDEGFDPNNAENNKRFDVTIIKSGTDDAAYVISHIRAPRLMHDCKQTIIMDKEGLTLQPTVDGLRFLSEVKKADGSPLLNPDGTPKLLTLPDEIKYTDERKKENNFHFNFAGRSSGTTVDFSSFPSTDDGIKGQHISIHNNNEFSSPKVVFAKDTRRATFTLSTASAKTVQIVAPPAMFSDLDFKKDFGSGEDGVSMTFGKSRNHVRLWSPSEYAIEPHVFKVEFVVREGPKVAPQTVPLTSADTATGKFTPNKDFEKELASAIEKVNKDAAAQKAKDMQPKGPQRE